MNLHNINTIARYEVKLLQRSWLFRIFAILALLGITAAMLYYITPTIFSFENKWARQAVSSQVPFFSISLYNMAMSVIAVFLAGSFLKRDKKLDTAEVIYVRPMSNADYIVGKTWGIVRVFFTLNVITLLITAFLHVLVAKSPFSVFPYVFYLFTISLPSLVFVLGLSFTVMCLLKNQAVTFVVMLGIIGVSFFYVEGACHGVFDFFGAYIPAVFSDVTGHPDGGMFLLQRAIYLLAGIGFICFTIALVKRLPHKAWKIKIVYSLGTVCLLAALAAGWAYTRHYRHGLQLRDEYIAVFNRYADRPFLHVAEHALTVTPGEGCLAGESRMTVENTHAVAVEPIVLYLNPALQVERVESGGKPLEFSRERQVVVIDKALAAGERMELVLHYRGEIDETVCYTDVLEKDYLDYTNPLGLAGLGKRYAWLEDRLTLLTPECLWYPVAVPPVHPAAPYDLLKDFTHYALTVNYAGEKTVLSQGECRREGDKVTFANRTALPCISLTIADYEKKSLQVDSVECDILYFRGHDFFSSYYESVQDTLPGFFREWKNDIEIQQGRDYPFRKFVLAETPIHHHAYVRNWKGYSEYVMPEILFVPERGALLGIDLHAEQVRSRFWLQRHGGMDEKEILVESLQGMLKNLFTSTTMQTGAGWQNQIANKFRITPMLYNHTGFVYAPEYAVLDIVLNTMQSIGEERVHFFWNSIINDAQRANFYLQEHSFKHAVSDLELKPEVFYEILKLKSKELKNWVCTRVPEEDFEAFLKGFFLSHPFGNISFDTFLSAFEARYDLALGDFLERWYGQETAPAVFIKDVDANQVVIDEETKYKIHFKLYNPSEVDALVTTEIMQGGGRQAGPRGGFNPAADNATGYYLIPAGEAREVKAILDERPANIRINTNISRNLPPLHTYNFPKIDKEIQDTLAGTFAIPAEAFRADAREIIVDNEGKGFRVLESNTRHKLKDLFQKEEEDKYQDFTFWWLPSKWTLTAADFCYGEIVQSAVYKQKGAGNNSVEWSADIPRDGYYEISVWNPKMMMPGRHRRWEREERNQTYTILYGDESEDITLDLENEELGWAPLGNFYLPKGTATILLTDKVSGDYVIADAVKFTRVN